MVTLCCWYFGKISAGNTTDRDDQLISGNCTFIQTQLVQKATITHILYNTFFSCGRFLSTTSLRQRTDANTFKMSKRTQEGTLSPKTPLCLKLRITTVIAVDKASKIITAAKYSPGNKMRKEETFISHNDVWIAYETLINVICDFMTCIGGGIHE